MAKPPPVSQDKRFHHEIWSGPSEAYVSQNPSIGYVENHNADWDYGLAADDYKFAADALIAEQKSDPHLSNWTAPICHLVRQTIELQLKFLLQMIEFKNDGAANGLAFTHDLETLWSRGKKWLVDNEHQISEDPRLTSVDRLVSNLHAIDPIGDLFRFGTSKHQAFGRAKTYDRVGYEQDLLFDEFEQAYTCIGDFASAIMQEVIADEDENAEFSNSDADDKPDVGDNTD